jgi:predicted enzyme related to lactoylglutathione lyase
VANVDELAKKAKSLGGKLKAEPFDVMDVGRMANVLEAQTNDIESARKFYSALFGWRLKISPQYTEAAVGDINTAGMMQMRATPLAARCSPLARVAPSAGRKAISSACT